MIQIKSIFAQWKSVFLQIAVVDSDSRATDIWMPIKIRTESLVQPILFHLDASPSCSSCDILGRNVANDAIHDECGDVLLWR